eukprot:scaffold66922_cov30-Tisochrysis_lutea.AAC.3
MFCANKRGYSRRYGVRARTVMPCTPKRNPPLDYLLAFHDVHAWAPWLRGGSNKGTCLCGRRNTPALISSKMKMCFSLVLSP